MNSAESIKKAGLKATPQRKMIYELMTKLGHSPMDEIIAKAQRKNPEITVSTVYRILDSFCKTGLLSKTSHPNGKQYYDITPEDHHHVFADNKVIDYINPELTKMVKKNLKGDLFKHLDITKISIHIIAKKRKEV
jgi:Fe2+ or Zn2+ uptake regulation protein